MCQCNVLHACLNVLLHNQFEHLSCLALVNLSFKRTLIPLVPPIHVESNYLGAVEVVAVAPKCEHCDDLPFPCRGSITASCIYGARTSF